MRVSAWNNGRHRFFNYSAYDSSAVQFKTYVFFFQFNQPIICRPIIIIINNNLGYYGLYVYIHIIRR